jgi:hypothetical protein
MNFRNTIREFIGLFVSIALFSCVHQPSKIMSPMDKDRILAETKSMFSNLTRYSESAKLDSFLDCYQDSPDFIQIAGDGKMNDYLEFKKLCEDYYGRLRNQEISIVKEKTNVLDTNLVIWTWTVNILAQFKNGDTMRMPNYSISYLIKKIAGNWKIIHAHESSVPPELIRKS